MVDSLNPPATDLEVYPDTGVKPVDLTDSVYEGGKQPIAEYDSWWHNRMSSTILTNRELIFDHEARHENGGPDELDLNGLSISDVATVSKPAANRFSIHPGSDTSRPGLLRFNTGTGTEALERLPPVTASATLRGGVSVENNPIDVTTQPITANGGSLKVWDEVNDEVPQPQLGGPAEHLTAYPLPNQDLANPNVTVNTGTGLSGGGQVQLGGSITLSSTDSGFDGEALREYDFAVEGGVVDLGDAAYVWMGKCPAGATVKIWAAGLIANNLGPVPSGLNLVLGRGDPTDTGGEQPYQRLSTIIAGDGSTRQTGEIASGDTPLASWTNSLGAPTDVFVAVDNGDPQIGLSGSNAERECEARALVQVDS